LINNLSTFLLMLCAFVLSACTQQTGDQAFIHKDDFCQFALYTFQSNDAQRYAQLIRNEQDLAWMKTYVTGYIPDAGKNRKVFQELLDNFPKYRETMTKRLDDDRILVIKNFSRIHKAGKEAGLNWKKVKVVKCEFEPLHKQFGIAQGLIKIQLQQSGNVYLVVNDVFQMGSRGFRAMATPHWKGKVR